MTLGEYLRSVREASGRPLREVADVLGLSIPYLSDVERGNRNVPPDGFDRWATAYGCKPGDIAARYVCPHCGRGTR